MSILRKLTVRTLYFHCGCPRLPIPVVIAGLTVACLSVTRLSAEPISQMQCCVCSRAKKRMIHRTVTLLGTVMSQPKNSPTCAMSINPVASAI